MSAFAAGIVGGSLGCDAKEEQLLASVLVSADVSQGPGKAIVALGHKLLLIAYETIGIQGR